MPMASTTPLNEDLYMEILKRLPIESTCRFRCVCKGWNSLISSSFFANHRLSNDSDRSFLLLKHRPYDNAPPLYSFYNPDDPHRLGFSPLPFNPPPIPPGFWYPYTVDADVDVIHGVVCLSYHRRPHCGVREFTERAVLWNPSIRKYLDIPLPPKTLVLGFGFDARESEFKVVARNYRDGVSFEVFETRERRWRRVDGADRISHRSQSYFTNGVIHWIGKELLVMFDCECEEWKATELPRELIGRPAGQRCLFFECYTGTVSMVAEIKHGIGLWVMEKHGFASSWKKLTCEQAKGFVTINVNHSIYQLWVDDNGLKWNPYRLVERPQQIYNGHVFKPSLFLMDGKSLA